MSALPTFFRTLLKTADLPISGADAEAFDGVSARYLKTIANQAVDLLGEGAGTVLVREGLRRSDLNDPLTVETLRDHSGFSALLAGRKTFKASDRNKALVTLIQRTFQAIAARTPKAPSQLLLPIWGADGGFGRESQTALRAFQRKYGLNADKTIGQEVAQKFIELLKDRPVPDLWAELSAEARVHPDALKVAQIARRICEAETRSARIRIAGRNYSYKASHFGVKAARNGHIKGPDRIQYGLRKSNDGYWKCNIFGGLCIGLADLPVPTFYWSTNHRTRHYFRAERFGPQLAKMRGWTLIEHLDHRDPRDETQAHSGGAENTEIAVLLDSVLPGDLFFVDHPGDPGNNGGHTRVCVEAAIDGDRDHAPLWAQASYDAAILRRDGMNMMGNGSELQFWLLRYIG